MPVSTFRHPELLKPENFSPVTKDSFMKSGSVTQKKVATKMAYRQVTFSSIVSIRPIIHVNDIPAQVIRDGWFSREECANIKKNLARTAKLISHGVYEGDDENHCARGLECRVRSGAVVRRENKLNGLMAVLDEQDRQFDLDIVDEDLIRDAFAIVNLKSRIAALKMGISDHTEANLIHAEENEKQDGLDDISLEDSSDDELDHCEVYQSRALPVAA